MDNNMNDQRAKLAYAALDSVPTPKSDAKEIIGLVKSSGRVTGYQLSDGSTVSKEEVPCTNIGPLKEALYYQCHSCLSPYI